MMRMIAVIIMQLIITEATMTLVLLTEEEGNDCNVDCNSIIDLDCDGGDDRKHGRVYDATNGEDDEVNDWIV